MGTTETIIADGHLNSARTDLVAALALLAKGDNEGAVCRLIPSFWSLDGVRRHRRRLAGRKSRKASYSIDAPGRARENIEAALAAIDADDIVGAVRATAKALGDLLMRVRPDEFRHIA